MTQSTDVFITVDTEFNIGGYFANPSSNRPVSEPFVLCEVDGKSHGLGFLLETFGTFGVNATFFVEAINTFCFGDDPMGAVVERVVAAGHDVQLHLHPVWMAWKDATTAQQVLANFSGDSLIGRSDAEIENIISAGLDAFERWRVTRPVALRIGNLQACRALYRVMTRVGLPLASNIALGVHRPAEPDLALLAGRHRIDGVVEVPVTTYTDLRLGGRTHLKSLTITGTSFEETRFLLESAWKSGVREIVLLTHPHEFAKPRRGTSGFLAPNTVNQRRLSRLCRYLRDNGDRFAATTFSAKAVTWPDLPSTDNWTLRVPAIAAIRRMVENKLNDIF